MARRTREPEEAFGPSVDGTEDLESLARYLTASQEEPEPLEEPEEEYEEPESPQIALICGDCDEARAVARLAAACGFGVELACKDEPAPDGELEALADVTHVLADYDDIVSACNIDDNHYVCVFVDDMTDCEHILSQCLASDAAYIGVSGDMAKARELLADLKAAGVPDTELAAVCCPMGLNLGAQGPEQKAVSVVAEVLAAKSGVLKRLRFGK